MEVLYKHGPLTAEQIIEKSGFGTHNSTLRTQLRILEHKGHVTHSVDKGTFVFSAVHPKDEWANEVIREMVDVYFDGNHKKAIDAINALYN